MQTAMSTRLTVPQAAAMTGLTRSALYRAIREERLPAHEVFGTIIVESAALREFAANAGVRNGYRKGGAGARRK